jgi:hypothetical protein
MFLMADYSISMVCFASIHGINFCNTGTVYYTVCDLKKLITVILGDIFSECNEK